MRVDVWFFLAAAYKPANIRHQLCAMLYTALEPILIRVEPTFAKGTYPPSIIWASS